MEYVDGNECRLGAEDLFFSTTDTKGVIRRTNWVFDSLSRHSSEELVGSLYNIIRHGGMPAGALRLMWDELERGRSSCAYMLNRAEDGRDYWVSATIAPLANGYLSACVRPINHVMFTPVKEIYACVQAAERACAKEGHGRRKVTERRAALLTEGLAKLQYRDLHNFARAALLRELTLLVVEGVRVLSRAELDNPISAVLQVVAAIERDTDELIYQLGEYQELINGLGSRAAGVRPVIDRADHVGSLMGEVTSPDAESSVPAVSERVKERGVQAVEVLGQLDSSLMALYEAASEVRFRSSTIRLYTLMAGIFAAVVLDGQEGEFDDAIGDLAEAMLPDLGELMPSCQEAANLVERLEGDLCSVVSNFDRVRRLFQRWTHVLQDEGAQALVEGIDAEVVLSEVVAAGERGFPKTASLAELAARARGVVITLDEPVIRQRVTVVRETLSYLGE